MKIKPAQIASFLRQPDSAVRAILVYGPDGGLVRERTEILARNVLGEDLSDPFRCTALYGETLANDPARLADEAAALSLIGGSRVVFIRKAVDSLTPVFKSFFSDPVGESLILVEAEELSARSSLRKAFEDSSLAAHCDQRFQPIHHQCAGHTAGSFVIRRKYHHCPECIQIPSGARNLTRYPVLLGFLEDVILLRAVRDRLEAGP